MPARRHEIGRKPRDEEDLSRVAAELTNGRADDLPLARSRPNVAPFESQRLALVLAAAARLDVVAARPGSRRHSRPGCDTAATRPRPKTMPTPPTTMKSPRQPKRCVNPEERHAEKPEARILSERIDRVGARTLALRKPGRQHPAVGRKARRFEHADADARRRSARSATASPP